MVSLKDLLEDIDVDLGDDDNKDQDQVDLKNINLNDIKDENARKVAEALINDRENLLNEKSRLEITLNALKDAMPKQTQNAQQTKQEDDNKDYTDTGDDDNPLVKEINSLKNEINSLKSQRTQETEQEFVESFKTFVKDNPDSVRYAKEMDELVTRHPTMRNIKDIPNIYRLAKEMAERRDELKTKTTDLKTEKNKRRTESSGVPNASEITGNAKTMSEAFELTEKQQINRR